jgi:hypothetical protein
MATGFKELVLVPALKEQGLTVLEARAVIDAVLGSIKDALGRHEMLNCRLEPSPYWRIPKNEVGSSGRL